jgi:hypothetical protein
MSTILAGYVIFSWLRPGDFLESALLGMVGTKRCMEPTRGTSTAKTARAYIITWPS